MLRRIDNILCKRKKFSYIGILSIFLLMSFSFVLADSGESHGHEEVFERAEQIIDSGVSCSELSEEDLEALGDYYMEQMHPGQEHVLMDQRMGGEGSEGLRNMHISMGIRFYCDEEYISDVSFRSGGYGMMGGGMMGNYGGSYGSSLVYWSVWWIITILILIILVLIIILLNKNVRRKRR